VSDLNEMPQTQNESQLEKLNGNIYEILANRFWNILEFKNSTFIRKCFKLKIRSGCSQQSEELLKYRAQFCKGKDLSSNSPSNGGSYSY